MCHVYDEFFRSNLLFFRMENTKNFKKKTIYKLKSFFQLQRIFGGFYKSFCILKGLGYKDFLGSFRYKEEILRINIKNNLTLLQGTLCLIIFNLFTVY